MTKAFNAVESVEQVRLPVVYTQPYVAGLLLLERQTDVHTLKPRLTTALHLGCGDLPQSALPGD